VELNDLLAADSCERALLCEHPPPWSCGGVVKPPTRPSASGAGGRQRDPERYRLCAHKMQLFIASFKSIETPRRLPAMQQLSSYLNTLLSPFEQAELEAANVTWSFTDYAHTVHAFTLPSNPLWTSGPARPCFHSNINTCSHPFFSLIYHRAVLQAVCLEASAPAAASRRWSRACKLGVILYDAGSQT